MKFGGPSVSTREIDNTGVAPRSPIGVPAGIIGTANAGPAFVPVTVADKNELFNIFGATDGKKFGPLAAYQWLRNAKSLTYLRVLGAGSGLQRDTSTKPGRVVGAGFVVGENQPSGSAAELSANQYANANGAPGRTLFLGCFMSESAGSTVFSAAGLQGAGSVTPGANTAVPILRGVLFAASGVVPRLSSSAEGTNGQPLADFIAVASTATGSGIGAVILSDAGTVKQEFVMLLNGHKGTDARYPNVLTASFDMLAPNYFASVFNTDPLKLQEAGHYLYAHWDVHPTLAVVTGAGLLYTVSGAGATLTAKSGAENSAFLLTSSLSYDAGSSTIPDYENWEDRFSYAHTPWITSQRLGGLTRDLFRFHARSAGAGVANKLKISIENIVLSTDTANQYCSFDVVVRDFTDRDSEQIVIEQFRGVNLDPTSERYISKIIGDKNRFYDFDTSLIDQRIVEDGSYDNVSAKIRVEVSSAVDDGSIDPTAVPFGHRGPNHIMTSGSAPLQSISTTQLSTAANIKRVVEMPVPYRQSITVGSGSRAQVDSTLYWGVQFEHVTDLNNMNASLLKNDSIASFALHFPTHMTTYLNVSVGSETVGALDTSANGIIDADRFCYNAFSLSNVKVVTGSNALADSDAWLNATYVRNGAITADDTAKTRALTPNDITNANRRFVKFTTILQGGFDGVNMFNADELNITDDAVKADIASTRRGTVSGPSVVSYTKAINVMKNTLESDVQVMAIPGIRQPTVTDAAINAVEDRVDAILLIDPVLYDSTDAAISAASSTPPSPIFTAQEFVARSLNSSFAAAYFPDVIMRDPTTNTNLTAPGTVAALAAISLNDSVGKPWLAPAGLTRGAIVDGVEPKVILSQEQINTLYDAALNPIISFASPELGGTARRSGAVVWGQKTLYTRANSALDRINVRRLLIAIRRIVRKAVMSILFEPNRESTLAKFTSVVNPQLQTIQQQRGLNGYRVVIDSTTTTQADVENNTVRGKILLAPVKSTEFVSLDFTVTNNGIK